MKRVILILFMLSVTLSTFAGNPVTKNIVNVLFRSEKVESGRIAKELTESATGKEISKVYNKECIRLCEKYPTYRGLIMTNDNYFVSLAKQYGDESIKHEISNPGIIKYAEEIFGKDGIRLLSKETPETFLNLTKYFKQNPEHAKRYLNMYKTFGSVLTPKNILATGGGLGIFKICCDIGSSIRESTSRISDIFDKIAEIHPIFTLFAIFATIAILFIALSEMCRRLFSKLFSVPLYIAKKFCRSLFSKKSYDKS